MRIMEFFGTGLRNSLLLITEVATCKCSITRSLCAQACTLCFMHLVFLTKRSTGEPSLQNNVHVLALPESVCVFFCSLICLYRLTYIYGLVVY